MVNYRKPRYLRIAFSDGLDPHLQEIGLNGGFQDLSVCVLLWKLIRPSESCLATQTSACGI